MTESEGGVLFVAFIIGLFLFAIWLFNLRPGSGGPNGGRRKPLPKAEEKPQEYKKAA